MLHPNLNCAFSILIISTTPIWGAIEENILKTEVFEIVLSPSMFNWTYEGNPNQYVYQPSLLDAPDLPSWISYVFSERHHSGFLYGVPPVNLDSSTIQLSIVALNRKTYDTRHEVLTIHISEKLNPARYEVHMKIDNLNVEDMFDVERMERLKDIYRKNLWKDSQNDLYVTFLASAIKLGARRPLNPNEGEGVVLRLGSNSSFSTELIELQEEVRPLLKVPSCPRDFKRTSVERFFRNEGFALDWCSFRLIDDGNFLNLSTTEEKLLHSIDNSFEDRWEAITKDEVPERSYTDEFLFTMLIPLLILLILALILSLILCFHHEGIYDPESEEYFSNLYHICTDYFSSKRFEGATIEEIHQYTTIHRATQSLRSLSNNRDIPLSSSSPDPMLLPSKSHTNSPTSTIGRGVHCRPSPPPYVRPKFKQQQDL